MSFEPVPEMLEHQRRLDPIKLRILDMEGMRL